MSSRAASSMEKGKLATNKVVFESTFSVWGLGCLGFLPFFFLPSPLAFSELAFSAGADSSWLSPFLLFLLLGRRGLYGQN
jgi:hypothetical protein